MTEPLTERQQRALMDVAAGLLIDDDMLSELISLGLVHPNSHGQAVLTKRGTRKYLEVIEQQEG